MGLTELHGKYKRLRDELEEAYAAPAWNRPRIDRIADELTETEQALASRRWHGTEPEVDQLRFEFAI
jgi:hypothetical protein